MISDTVITQFFTAATPFSVKTRQENFFSPLKNTLTSIKKNVILYPYEMYL